MDKELGFESFVARLAHPQFLKRLASSNNKNQPLRKAFGKLTKDDFIVDCTVGFAQDLLCMASWPAKTLGFERDPQVFTWLKQALNELKQKRPTIERICKNLEIKNLDAISALKNLNPRPTHIYVDPIYPQKEKSALGKLDLRLLKQHVGTDADSKELLQTCLQVATNRVIVKRPIKAEALIESPKASSSAVGTSTRYDIYFCK